MLNAYYFRHHMYSLVPRHVREDMKWMADIGTDAVSLAILEQDLTAARANVDILCAEIERAGMKPFAVPSRWAGLVAGAPKVPSLFAAAHPETWAQYENGTPQISEFSGPMCSLFHPQTREFWAQTTTQMLSQWPFAGITWDEPKCLHNRDFSPLAREKLGSNSDGSAYLRAVADFFEMGGRDAREVRSDVQISLFLMANARDLEIEILATTPSLDYFGCDGRPWRESDGGQLEAPHKVLIGQAERFLAAARKNGKRGLILVENHNMATPDLELMEKRLPEVLSLGAEQVIYYYFPRNLDDPERAMELLARGLKNGVLPAPHIP